MQVKVEVLREAKMEVPFSSTSQDQRVEVLGKNSDTTL